jgi:outer membrane protein assembly factor BamB
MAKNKKATVIAIFLTVTIALTLVALPVANAQAPQHTKATHAVCGVKPSPVGVGQEVLVWLGISDPLALDVHGWQGLTVTVTKPDGTTETLGPFKTDSTGSTGTVYTPTMVGNYTFQTHFPEQTYTWPPTAPRRPFTGTALYKASDSDIVELIVQEEPIPYYPAVPLPTEYWTRPITSQFREWSPIAGNWVNPTPLNFLAPYNDAPETAHILWSKPLTTGGLVGGDLGSNMYQTGDAYQGLWANSVIINGILYYNRFQLGFQGGIPSQGIVAVDLRTGEELWFRNNTRLAHGQVVYWQSFNLYGAYPYLWEVDGATWRAYDAYTGELVYTMINVPGGINYYGPRGEILRYVVNNAKGWMALWNTTRAVSLEGWTVQQIMQEIKPMALDVARAEFAHGSWIPFGRTINDSKAYSWNVTIPLGLPGAVMAVLDDRVIGSNLPALVALPPDPVVMWGISTAPGRQGQLLFNVSWPNPPGNLTLAYGAASLADGVFIIRSKDTRLWWGFSLDTGQMVWGPTESEVQLNIFDVIGAIADGKFFSMGQGGVLYCYNAKTGEKLWSYAVEDRYSEILWSNNWPMRILFITDGKIYLGQEEHSGNSPLPRGAPFLCLNVTTGEEIWKIYDAFRQNHWGGRAIIGDSIIATLDTYDNRIYAIGKGPSAVAVSIQDNVITHGDSVLIQGTVTDVSAGAKEQVDRFPNGVPAVADANMSEWMLYVYKQFPRPTDVTGVDVTLSVLDSNGNYRDIGTTTTDADGFYKLKWTPDIEGEYTVYASFAGSKSYSPSHAVTAFAVDPAPPAPAEPEPEPPSMTDTYVLGIGVAIIVAVAVVGDLTMLMLRKRP